MAWKLDDEGKILVDAKGNPIFVFSDGTEEALDYADERQKINELNEKNKKNQAAKSALDELFKLLGVDSVESAHAFVEKAKEDEAFAIELKQQTGGKKFNEVLELEKAKSARLENTIKEMQLKQSETEKNIARNNISNAFAKSKFINENIGDVTLAEKLFFDSFKVEDGKIVGYIGENRILNDKGDPDFDFAIEKLVNDSTFKDKILKSKGNPGAGSGGGGAGAGGADLSKMNDTELMKYAKEHPEALQAVLQAIKNKNKK